MTDRQSLRINADRLRDDINALSAIGRNSRGILYRPAFSPQYEEARAWLRSRLTEAGIRNRNDAVGNIIGRIGKDDTPCVMAGSHIDTVPDGGPLDGAYGVLAALEVARVLKQDAAPLPAAFECVAFVDEEGHYFDALGSKTICGLLDMDELYNARNAGGEALVTAMQTAGFEPADAGSAVRHPGEISAYVELHIEQGPVLESLGVPIGNVDAIVGNSNLWITFTGDPNHSGTTPMDLRRDAFTGAAEFCTRARAHVLRHGTPDRVRITYGIVELKPNSHNIVPGQVRLFQEIREVADDTKEKLAEETMDLAREIASTHRLEVSFENIPQANAAHMSTRVRNIISAACGELGIPAHDMPSGALHDAQTMALITDSGMIFVPSKGGRSHRRDENTDWRHLEQGANVLLHTVLRLMQDQD